ncbi:hypothetical protein C8J56DRAFT_901681 [Mycena floridula]|nr:hypothetical protein C8J56DRAFT_901681 [Mycena floridula]
MHLMGNHCCFHTDFAIAWAFSDHAVDVQQFRAQIHPQWVLARINKATESTPPVTTTVIHASINLHVDPYAGMPSLPDMLDSDELPYNSDCDSDSDDGMPPLIDLSDSDSGYGSD